MSEPVNQINHAEVIRDYLEDPMMSAGPSKALASLAAMQKELEEAKRPETNEEWQILARDHADLAEKLDNLRTICTDIGSLFQVEGDDDPEPEELRGLIIKALQPGRLGVDQRITEQAATITAQAERIARLEEALGKCEASCLEVIQERDDAESALSDAVQLVTGHYPEWSNCYGKREALEEIGDALTVKESITAQAERIARLEEALKHLMVEAVGNVPS